MGFLDGKFATHALLSIKGAITAKSYNAAVKALKNQKTDILCKPCYVGNLPYHIPNNRNIIVDYKNGNVVVKDGLHATSQAGRPGDRPDPRLGEEVPPEHRQVAKQRIERDDDQGARRLR